MLYSLLPSYVKITLNLGIFSNNDIFNHKDYKQREPRPQHANKHISLENQTLT